MVKSYDLRSYRWIDSDLILVCYRVINFFSGASEQKVEIVTTKRFQELFCKSPEKQKEPSP